MGFFRFRRSIKLLPGVRLNIGKKGTSVSVGVRGLHYTIGSQGTRTTVGLPGSGLSYTSTQKYSAGKSGRALVEIEKANRWAKQQTETFHFEVPDKSPEEEPATPEQRKRLGELAFELEGKDLATLGRDQADFVIATLEAEKARLTQQKIQEYQYQQNNVSSSTNGLLIFAAIVMVILIFALCLGR